MISLQNMLKSKSVVMMNRLLSCFLFLFLLVLSACDKQSLQAETPNLCNQAWYRSVESIISSGDGMGHGPDIGSDEWRSVIEFKLGVRGSPDVPDRDSQQWCRYIDELIKANE